MNAFIFSHKPVKGLDSVCINENKDYSGNDKTQYGIIRNPPITAFGDDMTIKEKVKEFLEQAIAKDPELEDKLFKNIEKAKDNKDKDNNNNNKDK
jgi:hypothetical protein